MYVNTSDSQTCYNSGPTMVIIAPTVCPEDNSGTDDNIKLRFRVGHSNGELAANECDTNWLDTELGTTGCLK